MNDDKLRADARACFVCGPDNPAGLGVQFHLDGTVCRGEFTPGRWHGGFDGLTHGGILFSVLDDVMANWLYLQGIRAVTAKCEIRFRQALPIGTAVALECGLKQRKRKLVQLHSQARRKDDDALIAVAEASFMIEPEEVMRT